MSRRSDGNRHGARGAMVAGAARRPVARCRPDGRSRRGVASVLSMMFLVIFGSLAAVMAVVAQGNVRTAHSHLQVNKAMSAAETGLSFAARRLTEAAQRFVVEKGLVTDEFGEKLWNGTWEVSDGEVTILDPEGFVEGSPATSLATAVLNAHVADEHNLIIDPGDELLPDLDEFGKLVVQPISVTSEEGAAYFRLSYEPLADGRFVRVISVGCDGSLTRTLQVDFQIVKRLDAAIISPNRIMIGKNVHIDGPIGTRFGEDVQDLQEPLGHPIVMKSDFRHLDVELDARIETFVVQIGLHDVNGDNRLRPGHPTERDGLTEPYMVDANDDGYVDDYDLWLDFYDANEDALVVWDADLAYAAGRGTMDEEFAGIDDDLATMIDGLNPDRNGDGAIDEADTLLGYMDGVIDTLDGYAKVHGNLLFKASKESWEAAQGGQPWQSFVNGPVEAEIEYSSTQFEVPDTRLYDLSITDFTNAQNTLKDVTVGSGAFVDQLEAQLGGDPTTHVWSDHPTEPDYLRPDLGIWEQMPLGSPGFYDWYQRPIYKNMTFVNVAIPQGNNGLFINCTFIGAVYVQTHSDNTHHNWNFLGIKELVDGNYVDKYDYESWEPVLEISGNPVYDTKPFSNNIRFHSCAFIGSVVSDPAGDLTHVRNKLQFTGATHFSLNVEDIQESNLTTEEKELATQKFNESYEQLRRSSLLVPNFSVDVGSFENAAEVVEMQGTIVAGILDVRGRANIVGALLMTFKPRTGEGPLYYGGPASAFNTTLGYFSPEDGDGEGGEPLNGFGNITLRYDADIPMPDGIKAPIKAVAVPGTYVEGATP
ncbi:MAG: hypothetical protein IT430_05325 [Phycisphaerales bacterium]|nr:hypothetical protein [Phycisphaerales bacterium]